MEEFANCELRFLVKSTIENLKSQILHTFRTLDFMDFRLSDSDPHFLHKQRGVEAGADARREPVVEEELLIV